MSEEHFLFSVNTAQCRATNCQSHGEHTGIKSLLSWGYNWSNIESFKNCELDGKFRLTTVLGLYKILEK